MAAIQVNLKGLNPAQLQAVRQTEGPVLILAGAGSGKTRVITTRITFLLASDVPPERILAVTFTNKAANEMRERVGGMVPKAAAKKLTLSTFHALCVKILRSGIERLGYKSNFTIYTGSDQIGLVRTIIGRRGGKATGLDPYKAQSQISAGKSKGTIGNSGDPFLDEIAREYQRQLKLHNAVDFDDLLGLAVDLLEGHADVREQWQSIYHYIMVDEFQDTNRQQMELVRLLSGTRHNVCVVGDDDQSIYGWRGAESANILEFERFFPNPCVIKLMENYRSQAPILETANAVIRHNRGRREKQLIPTKPGRDPVRLISMPGDAEEAEFIINEIWSANTVERRPWDDFAILFRTNSQSRRFEEALRKQGIPYRILGGQSFFERKEVKDVVAYLNVIINPDDDVNLLRIINNPPRGIGEATTGAATDASIEAKVSVFAMLRDPEFTKLLGTKTQRAVAAFTDQVEAWRQTLQRPGLEYAAFAESIVKETGFLEYLTRNCDTPEESMSREANVREMLNSLYEHQKNKGNGLRHFLDGICLDDDRGDEKEKAAEKPGLWLITLHASKGLEFPVVYLVGLEEGILPHKRSMEEGTRDEERRLLYVGITRAKEKLTMTHCHSRIKYGDPLPVMPSSFIKELPTPPVEVSTYEQIMDTPATMETAKSHLAKIREMLNKE